MAGTHREAETEVHDGSMDDTDTDVEESKDTSAGRWSSLLTTAKEIIGLIIRAWMVVVQAFSWVLARVVALVLFVIAFVPYGLVMRVVGFDPLRCSFDQETDSYWNETESTNRDLQSFRKQY